MQGLTTIQYLVLLRGINVGGNNIIKMAALKTCFETMGFAEVRTYIQSGNVLFHAVETDTVKLSAMISQAIFETFGYQLRMVIISHKQLKEIVATAPREFGKEPEIFRYDVLFFKGPLTPVEAMQVISTKEGVDFVETGKHVLYFSRLSSKSTQSHMTKITAQPMYQQLTIRNWNTTTRLLALMEKAVL